MTRYLNLLPPERRTALGHEQLYGGLLTVLRTVLAGLSLLTMAAVGLGVALQVLLAMAPTDAAETLQDQLAVYRELTTTIDQYNLLLEEIGRIDTERILWSRVMIGALGSLPPGVVVDELLIDADTLTMTFLGRAPDRSAVVALETRLRALPWVATVTSPRDNLLDRFNARYQFELQVDATAAQKL